jgi:chromosome segregation ATPase
MEPSASDANFVSIERAKITQLESIFRGKQARIAELNEHVTAIEAARSAQQVIAAAAISEAHAGFQQAKSINDQCASHIEQLQHQLAAAQATNNTYQAQIQDQHRQLSELNATLAQERADATARIKKLEWRLQQTKSSEEIHTTRAAQLEGIHKEARPILQALCTTLGVTAPQNAKATNHIKRLQALLDGSTDSLQACQEKLRQLTTESSQKRARQTVAGPSDEPAQRLRAASKHGGTRPRPVRAAAATSTPVSIAHSPPSDFSALSAEAEAILSAQDEDDILTRMLGTKSPTSFWTDELGDLL